MTVQSFPYSLSHKAAPLRMASAISASVMSRSFSVDGQCENSHPGRLERPAIFSAEAEQGVTHA